MPDIPRLLAALAEPTRLRAMQIVWRGGEHCVCDLMSALDATQSRMSRQSAFPNLPKHALRA